MTTVITEATE